MGGTITPTIDTRLRAQVAAHPAKPAVLDDAGTLTYEQLEAAADGIAAALQRRGVAPGEHVALLLGNTRDCVVAYFAVVRAGAVPVPFHPELPAPELHVLLGHSDAVAVIAEAESTPAVDAVRPTLTARQYLLMPRGAGDGAPASLAGWEALSLEPGPPTPVAANPAGVAALHYTSGTTGRPKGVLYSHRGIVTTAEIKANAYGVHAGSVLFCSPPVHHAAAWVSAIHVVLLGVGGAVALTRQREPSWVADLLAARRVTFMWTVPTTYLLLLDVPDLATRDLSALESCLFAAMPMPGQGLDRLRAVLPHVRLIAVYGQTEANGGTLIQGDQLLAKPGSVGRPLPDNDVRVIDPAGRDCPPGAAGDVLLRGPGLMLGYYKDPTATAAAWHDGWLRSGDAGYLDADRYLYLLGRTSETITWGGEKINPVEVEEVLLQHPAVREAAVLGLPDPYYRQIVAAAVVLRDGAAVTAADLEAHCRAHLAYQKVPTRIDLVPTLPRSASGKVQKSLLTNGMQTPRSSQP